MVWNLAPRFLSKAKLEHHWLSLSKYWFELSITLQGNKVSWILANHQPRRTILKLNDKEVLLQNLCSYILLLLLKFLLPVLFLWFIVLSFKLILAINLLILWSDSMNKSYFDITDNSRRNNFSFPKLFQLRFEIALFPLLTFSGLSNDCRETTHNI